MCRAFLIAMLFASSAIADDAADEKAKKVLAQLQGKWTAIEGYEGKLKLDAESMAKFPFTFDGDKLEMIHEGKNFVKLAVKLRPDEKPGQIDATFPADVNGGQTMLGIYKLEDEKLSICFGTKKDGPRPTTFDGLDEKGKRQFFVVLKKAK